MYMRYFCFSIFNTFGKISKNLFSLCRYGVLCVDGSSSDIGIIIVVIIVVVVILILIV